MWSRHICSLFKYTFTEQIKRYLVYTVHTKLQDTLTWTYTVHSIRLCICPQRGFLPKCSLAKSATKAADENDKSDQIAAAAGTHVWAEYRIRRGREVWRTEAKNSEWAHLRLGVLIVLVSAVAVCVEGISWQNWVAADGWVTATYPRALQHPPLFCLSSGPLLERAEALWRKLNLTPKLPRALHYLSSCGLRNCPCFFLNSEC